MAEELMSIQCNGCDSKCHITLKKDPLPIELAKKYNFSMTFDGDSQVTGISSFMEFAKACNRN